MKTRNKLIAGVGGVALIAGIAGMSTFALWSDTDLTDGGTVRSGNLDVQTLETDWQIVSEDLIPHTIDIDTFRAVPGDVVTMSSPISIGLQGDHIAATLDTSTLESGIIASGAEDSVELDFQLYEADGITPIEKVDGVYRFSSEDQDVDFGGTKVPAEVDDNRADVVATVTVTFDADAQEDVLTSLADFETAGVTLTQVRDGAPFVEEETED